VPSSADWQQRSRDFQVRPITIELTMKPTRHFAYALFATLLLSTASQALDAWTTVDSVEGGDFLAIVADRNGAIFTAGRVNVSDSTTHAIVRRSLDQGSSWETVLDIPPADGASANFFNDLALGPGGEVYALQRSSPPLSGRVWRTTDQGQTWQEMTRPPEGYLYLEFDCGGDGSLYACVVLDDGDQVVWHTLKGNVTDADRGTISWSFVDTLEGDSARPLALATRPSQGGVNSSEVWVGGWQGTRWRMRRSLDDGMTWSTVPIEQDGYINALAFGDGAIYAVGTTEFSGPASSLVRVSRDGGTNWSVADTFSDSSYAQAIATGSSGLVLVAGKETVRASRDHGATWSTSDQLEAGENGVYLLGITVDPSGNAYACGRQNSTGDSPQQGFVRRLQAPEIAPMLSVRTEVPPLVVTWPSTATGFVLEGSPEVTPTSWSPVPGTPHLNGDDYELTVPIDGLARFFRLRKP